MGRCLAELAARDPRFDLVASMDRAAERALPTCDVLIDFTDAAGTVQWLGVCRSRRCPMVVGATGHDDRQTALIVDAAQVIPIVKSANFSVGMTVVLEIAGRLAEELGADYDVEIVETHHRHKTDAPSATALAIADEIERRRNQNRKPEKAGSPLVFGRHGKTGERPKGQIAIHAVRMGDLVGQHEIHFSAAGETITLRHTAHSREAFAAGALRAAAWVVGKPAGLYGIMDVQ